MGDGENKNLFYQSHLDRVSRSFAFCIQELSNPMQEWVGLSYILCRLADTIEDTRWSSLAAQRMAFSEFSAFITHQSLDFQRIEQWVGNFPGDVSAAEKSLLADSAKFISHLHALPEPVKRVLSETILNMVRGMEHFSNEAGEKRELRLADALQTNEYCFFVAGVIGELLTKLFELTTPKFNVSQELLLQSFHFGVYLQKINILKDELEDRVAGRNLVFSREKVLEGLYLNAREAIEYIKSLPVSRSDYRLFCAWSLFLGLATIPWIKKSWAQGEQVKISRTETIYFLAKVGSIVDDNSALERLFSQYVPSVERPKRIADSTPWLQRAYRGDLSGASRATLLYNY